MLALDAHYLADAHAIEDAVRALLLARYRAYRAKGLAGIAGTPGTPPSKTPLPPLCFARK